MEKGFRCRLANLRADQIFLLSRWAENNCTLHTIFKNDTHQTIFIGLQSKARTCKSFCRSIRAVCNKFCIDTRALKGQWLSLLTVKETIAICQKQQKPIPLDSASEDDDVKIIVL